MCFFFCVLIPLILSGTEFDLDSVWGSVLGCEISIAANSHSAHLHGTIIRVKGEKDTSKKVERKVFLKRCSSAFFASYISRNISVSRFSKLFLILIVAFLFLFR